MTQDKIFHYDDDHPERIDVFLTKNNEYTRNFFHRVLARGDVLVNGKIVTKKSLKLRTGDEVLVREPERYLEVGRLADSPALDLKILIEKEDYLVLYKPKGVLSHPNSTRGVEHPNIVGALYHYFQNNNLPSTGNFIRAGLIHRLDKETDGLMLIVKTEKGLKYFKNLFQQKSGAETIADKELVPLKKFYRAQVLVTPQGEKFLNTLETPHIIEELVKPKVPHYEPKMGITKITSSETTPDEQFINLEVEILTGRTHQIRYHLSTHGLPVRGDYLYMNDKQYDEADMMYLQAYRLQFLDIEGEMVDIECEKSW